MARANGKANGAIPIEFARMKKSPKARYFMSRVGALLDYLGHDWEKYGRLNERVRPRGRKRRDIWSEHFAMEALIAEEVGQECLSGRVANEKGEPLHGDELARWWEGRIQACVCYLGDDEARKSDAMIWAIEETRRLYGTEGPKNHWALLSILEGRVLDAIRCSDEQRQGRA